MLRAASTTTHCQGAPRADLNLAALTLAIKRAGLVYFVDERAVRSYSPSTLVIATLAGHASDGATLVDGEGVSATFLQPNVRQTPPSRNPCG